VKREVAPAGSSVTGNVELSIGGKRLRLELEVPRAPTRAARLLPIFQSVANAVVDIACESAAAEGKSISCSKGCGACCRQLVPISSIEARRLRELLDELPPARGAEVRARFAQARERLADAGLLEALLEPERISDERVQAFGLDYFSRGIACPFLEDESCSIHAERPIACREYLVTSPAEHCARPSADSVERVNMPAKVGSAVRKLQAPGWVPLIVAPEWADSHPDENAARPGPEIAREFFSALTGKSL
jgi:Fe-S-cluster containining protein